MKLIILFLAILIVNSNYAQKDIAYARIYDDYVRSGRFYLTKGNNAPLMSFVRKGRVNNIIDKGEECQLYKRKILKSSNGQTIAYFKRRKIHLTYTDVTIKEIHVNNGLNYYTDNGKILEVTWDYDKYEKIYLVTVRGNFSNNLTRDIIKISLARIDRHLNIRDEDRFVDNLISVIVGVMVSELTLKLLFD